MVHYVVSLLFDMNTCFAVIIYISFISQIIRGDTILDDGSYIIMNEGVIHSQRGKKIFPGKFTKGLPGNFLDYLGQ